MRADDHAEPRLGRWLGAGVQVVAAALLTLGLLVAANWAAGRYLARRAGEVLTARLERARGDFTAALLAWTDLSPVPLVEDPELLWRNAPGAHRTQPVNPQVIRHPAEWTVDNDRNGYRDGPGPLAAEHEGVYRVLCVGDSITFGFNVDGPDAYPRQLARLLETRYPGRRFQVLNAAVAGWSWVQGRRFLELEGLALRPDLVIIGHGTNDQFFPGRQTDLDRIARHESRLGWLRRHVAFRLQHTDLFRLAAYLAPPGEDRVTPGCAAQLPDLCRRVSLPDIEATIHEVAAATAAAGSDLLIVNLDFTRTRAVRAMRAAVERDGLRFVDFVDRFQERKDAADDARAAAAGLPPAAILPALHPDGPRRVLLRVRAARPEAAHSVQGVGYLGIGDTFDLPLHDDGTAGDERAGDGVFSSWVELSRKIPAIEYWFLEDGLREFLPLPPLESTNGVRVLRFGGSGDDVVAPVDELGNLFLMAEKTHPDRRGHALIAAGLADEVERLPSMRRFLADAP